MSGLIIEVNRPKQSQVKAHRVYVAGPYEDYEGTIIKGNPISDHEFDIDAPFTIETDDGEKVRVVNPWACHIERI